jgi:hypothetical protein
LHPKKAPGFYDLKSRKTLVRPALPGAVIGQSAIKGACPYSCNLFATDLVTPKAVTFVPNRSHFFVEIRKTAKSGFLQSPCHRFCPKLPSLFLGFSDRFLSQIGSNSVPLNIG